MVTKLTWEQRCSYDGIEHRCHELNDMWVGPCQLLGALVADEVIAQLWERGDFDYLDEDELQSAHRATFARRKATVVRNQHRMVWDVALEYMHAHEN